MDHGDLPFCVMNRQGKALSRKPTFHPSSLYSDFLQEGQTFVQDACCTLCVYFLFAHHSENNIPCLAVLILPAINKKPIVHCSFHPARQNRQTWHRCQLSGDEIGPAPVGAPL